MSISSSSSLSRDSLDALLPPSLDTSSVSSADPDTSDLGHVKGHSTHGSGKSEYESYIATSKQVQGSKSASGSLLSVPGVGEDKRFSTGSGMTIRPPGAGNAPAREKDSVSTHSGSTSSGRRSSQHSHAHAHAHAQPQPPIPGPVPPPKPSTMRGTSRKAIPLVPPLPARPSTADAVVPHPQPVSTQQSSSSSSVLPARDRSLTLAPSSPSPPRQQQPAGPPTSLPPVQRRRSLTALPSPARVLTTATGNSVSPPSTPPHHNPTFPLRPSAPNGAQPAGKNVLKRDASASSASSGASAANESKPKAKLASRVFGWATNSSNGNTAASISAQGISAPVLPPRPERAAPPPALKRPLAVQTTGPGNYMAHPEQQVQQLLPPPRHPQAHAISSPTRRGPVPISGPYPTSPTTGNAGPDRGREALRAGWGRVQGLFGQSQRRMESISQNMPLPMARPVPRVGSNSNVAGPWAIPTTGGDAHLPIMPRPVRSPSGRPGQVFGVKLGEAVRRTRIVSLTVLSKDTGAEDRSRWLPALILRCLEHLERWGPEEEGIFRISGMPSHVATLREEFDRGADYDLRAVGPADLDPHAVAGVFKAYFRELPEPLLTHYLAKRFDEALLPHTSEHVPSSEGLSAFGHASSTPLTTSPQLLLDLAHLVRQLPPENRILLRELSRLLKFLARKRETTRMSLTNLLLVICPSVGIASSLVKIFVEEDDLVFGFQEEASGARELAAMPSAERDREREREVKKKRRETVGSVRTTASSQSYHAPATPPANITTSPMSMSPNGANHETAVPKRDHSLPPTTQPAPSSRRNSVQPRLMTSKIPNVLAAAPGHRRRASVQQQAMLLPISGVAPAPVIPAKPEALSLHPQGAVPEEEKENRPQTPSPPPQLALELPDTPLQIPFDRTPSVDDSVSPSSAQKKAGFFGDLFGASRPRPLANTNTNTNGSEISGKVKRDGPPPRVSIMSKLRPTEDWGSRVLSDAGVPPVPPLPGNEALGSPGSVTSPTKLSMPRPAVLRKGAVRDRIRNIEDRDGAKTDGEAKGVRRFVRTREKESDGEPKRGAFFPFN